MNEAMPFRITIFPGHPVGQQGRYDGLTVRPPELHVMPVFLDRITMDINKVEQPAVLLIPSPLLHVIEHPAPERGKFFVSSPPLRLVQDEPRRLDGMSGIHRATVQMIVQ